MSTTEAKYDVTVPLTGQDGNIFFIMGRVRGALKQAGASEGELEAFANEVTQSESYEAALRVVMRWVKVT